MTFFYFAYGSNMLSTRLIPRCPGAVAVGRADADGFAVEFTKPSIDGSGKATLREAAGSRTIGVLFEIPKTELGLLDRAEGRGNGYKRCHAFPVRLADGGKTIQAAAYLATDPDRRLKPYNWYLALVVAGAREHRLGQEYLAALRRVAYGIDAEMARKSRQAAIEALVRAGVTDYRELFSKV